MSTTHAFSDVDSDTEYIKNERPDYSKGGKEAGFLVDNDINILGNQTSKILDSPALPTKQITTKKLGSTQVQIITNEMQQKNKIVQRILNRPILLNSVNVPMRSVSPSGKPLLTIKNPMPLSDSPVGSVSSPLLLSAINSRPQSPGTVPEDN